jgi:hypothetical protein
MQESYWNKTLILENTSFPNPSKDANQIQKIIAEAKPSIRK